MSSQFVGLHNLYLPLLGGGAINGDVTVNGKLSADSLVVNKVEQKPSILWSGSDIMAEGTTITLSDLVSNQPHGIILVHSLYTNNQIYDSDFTYTFVPKFHVETFNGRGVHCSAIFYHQNMGKYLYVANDEISGYYYNDKDSDSNGIMIHNAKFVLRYVLGV